MKIPGVVWTVLLVFLPLSAGYITDFFGQYDWSGAAAGFLTALAVGIAKVMSEMGKTAPNQPDGVAFSDAPSFGVPEQPSLARRILLG